MMKIVRVISDWYNEVGSIEPGSAIVPRIGAALMNEARIDVSEINFLWIFVGVTSRHSFLVLQFHGGDGRSKVVELPTTIYWDCTAIVSMDCTP